jgi:enamine deaminase RidA (YjgF/YER057c/UK114 family)
VFENLRRCLAAAGLSFAEVIKLTYYLTDVAHLPSIRAVRDEFIDTSRPPASTAVQVVALVRPEFLLEVEAFALAGDGR